MTLYMIERSFPDGLALTPEAAAEVKRINTAVGVTWKHSFVSADTKKTFCLYEAPSPELILEAARRAGLPADKVTPVGEVQASAFG